jgi:hypothetical protein
MAFLLMPGDVRGYWLFRHTWPRGKRDAAAGTMPTRAELLEPYVTRSIRLTIIRGKTMNSNRIHRHIFAAVLLTSFAALIASSAFAVPFHIRTTVYAFKDNDPAFSDFIADAGTGGQFRATISSDGALQHPSTLATPTEWRTTGASGLQNPMAQHASISPAISPWAIGCLSNRSGGSTSKMFARLA